MTGPTLTERLATRAADLVGARTSRRGFLGRSAMVGSAVAVAGTDYVLRPGTAYAAVTRTRCGNCPPGSLCCDGYTDFCCHVYPETGNDCPPGTLLAGWWKVDRSDFCFGTARYYLDCNKASPGCGCGSSGACQDDPAGCGCLDCGSRKDGCTVFRYGNCNNQIACVGPIMCRLVTCTKPWEIEPNCSQVPRTDANTRFHHRPCLERDPTDAEAAFIEALFADFLGRRPDASGEAYWGNLLVRGSHLDDSIRDVIGESFAFSAEYRTAVVDRLYAAAFGRTAEQSARDYWSGRLAQDLTPEDLAVVFLASDEFYARSDGDDATFVRRLYRTVLRRDAGESEVQERTERLGEGRSRAAVAREVFASVESRRIRVQDLYQRFLGRTAEDAGRDYWVDVLATREDIGLALFLAASDEYYERALRRFPDANGDGEPTGPSADDPGDDEIGDGPARAPSPVLP